MEFVVEDWLAPSVMRWPDTDVGPWELTFTWREDGARVECVGIGLILLRSQEIQPVTASLIRSLPVAGVISRAKQDKWREAGGSLLQALDDGQDIDIGPGLREQLRAEVGSWTERAPGRPVEHGDEHYREVAIVYSAALAAGRPPLVAVKKRWTVSRPTASRWVAAARAAGLLPATERGRARGNAAFPTNEKGTR